VDQPLAGVLGLDEAVETTRPAAESARLAGGDVDAFAGEGESGERWELDPASAEDFAERHERERRRRRPGR
jgi:hypothetical protein